MSAIRNIPYESRILSFVTDSIPMYSEKKQDWILVSKPDLASTIQKLQKENEDAKITELLTIAKDPELKISSVSKNKSIRLNLDSAFKLMYLSLLNEKNKTDIFKTIVKHDLTTKIDDLAKIKKINTERIKHLKKISANWLKLKQDQYYDDFTLGYSYYEPSENIIEYLIDITINRIRTFLKTNNVPDDNIETFLNKFINKSTVTNPIEAEGFSECHEVKIELQKNKAPYLVIKMNILPYFPIKEYYDSFESFEEDVPKSIQPLLDKMFWTEELYFDSPETQIPYFLPKGITIIDLPIDFDKHNNLLLEGINIHDEKFIEKVLQKITENKPQNTNQINKRIVELTAQGKYVEAIELQNTININKNEVETKKFYLQMVKELPSQIFSFSVSKNLLMILDSLLYEESAEERIFSWEGKVDEQ